MGKKTTSSLTFQPLPAVKRPKSLINDPLELRDKKQPF